MTGPDVTFPDILHDELDLHPSVLLVDDQPMIAEAVRRALEKDPEIEFLYCQDPGQAVKTAVEWHPTVILQDLVMPDIDGLTLVRYYRANPKTRRIPIIVLSVKEDPVVKSEAFAVGANDYLVKLPDSIELIARIRYHSRAYLYHVQRDQAFLALKESERRLEESNAALERLSTLDGLTGIANRRRFDEALAREWRRAARDGHELGLVLLDIDHFKAYNDTYGHLEGDDCLKQVAAAVEKAMRRPGDLAARYGGEEFAAILPETGIDGARKRAEAIRAAVEALGIPHEASPVADHVTVSLGAAAAAPGKGGGPEDLIQQADAGLYAAKEGGRNRVGTV
ncbi:diguanylate cyclase [Dissulfurirhabdus thermomarina]|uniref:Diguanylate cyclase n=1 Tax=Dissulfurirhabdus thermomarina TaxID=1765737 RepID=A0A6N9TPX8_DISTH|nr:diguanylate cyclase [Dissulfurirhabdus thermomarina]NDY43219.1 diguanylate cyclase [Dissulfurirhabdus thermomarina]NMX23220.1 diguanylate cyclase [Dissulfurirhabdus thermomarina]